MKAPFVSFVIPVKNDAQRLRRCLETIARNQYPRWRIEVIVVDNGSVDASVAVATAAGATVVEVPERRVGELRNRGAAMARGDILAFVDADHEIDGSWVVSAVHALQERGIGAVGALYHAPENGTWVQHGYDALRGRMPGRRDVEWLGTGNLAVWRSAFEAQGGFDTTLEACEDVDFCQRLRHAGFRIVSDDRLKSVHLGDPATLGAVFRGELWRGRNSIRTSLRGPLSMRALPSVAFPVINLAMMALGILGLLASPLAGGTMPIVAVAVIFALTSLHTLRIATRRRPQALSAIAQTFLVVAVYDAARALALVARTGHAVRTGAAST